VIIVAGKLILKSGVRHEFIEKSREVISQARELESCDDFSVSPDPIDENRVNISLVSG
jgi:quinol monooxygenase YgiN